MTGSRLQVDRNISRGGIQSLDAGQVIGILAVAITNRVIVFANKNLQAPYYLSASFLGDGKRHEVSESHEEDSVPELVQ